MKKKKNTKQENKIDTLQFKQQNENQKEVKKNGLNIKEFESLTIEETQVDNLVDKVHAASNPEKTHKESLAKPFKKEPALEPGNGSTKKMDPMDAEAASREPSYPAIFQKRQVIPAHIKSPKKFSSTSTLYLDSTISAPKNKELMTAMAELVKAIIHPTDQCTKEEKESFEIFDEEAHPLSKVVDTKVIPEVVVIEKFIKNIFNIGQLAPESVVMAVAYLKRVMEVSTFKLYPFNWRRMILECLILASKVWEDQAVWNVDFLDLFPLANTKDLGKLEKKVLSLLSFDVSLKRGDYAKTYFDLRAQSKESGKNAEELKPLDKDGEDRLEARSKDFSEKHSKTLRESLRTGSIEDLQGFRSPRVILS